jgi:uncharacterized protein YjbI with pentapeptide repeats
LQGAYLPEVQLQGAILQGAELQSADLSYARLAGADLRGAKLQGAELVGAELRGADLRASQLWQTTVDDETNLGLADLRRAWWRPIETTELARLRKIIDAIPVYKNWLGMSVDREPFGKARLERLIEPGPLSDDPPAFALDGVLLVDDVEDTRWQRLDRARLSTDERAYDEALVPFLADLARSDLLSPT